MPHVSGRQALTLLEWAIKHRIHPDALRELCQTCIYTGPELPDGQLETNVQRDVRLEYAYAGKYLYRNNRGAGRMDTGTYVRWGLANDSKALGDAVKSADLIGWESIEITPVMVGARIARFLSVECKRESWEWKGTLEEMAQLKWAALVNSEGGRAVITNKVGTATG